MYIVWSSYWPASQKQPVGPDHEFHHHPFCRRHVHRVACRSVLVRRDHLAPGRRHEARAPDRNELAATTVLRMPLFEAAAKIRAWGPKDKEEDMNWPVWAGVMPLRQAQLKPVAEPGGPAETPAYVQQWASA